MDDEGAAQLGFVAVDRPSLDAVIRVASEVRELGRRTRGGLRALLELAEDYKIEAARRLRERGASEAQLERHEAAYLEEVARAHDTLSALEAACEALEARARALG